MTIKQIDAHLELHSQDLKSGARIDVCKYYTAIAPILKFVLPFFKLKPKWETGLKAFIAAMDINCKL